MMTTRQPKRRKLTARLAAAHAVHGVFAAGSSLDAVLPELQKQLADPRDRSLARELSAGTLRWYYQLDKVLDSLGDKRIKDNVIRAVLLCGLYQLGHTRIPPHAAISESVQTVKDIGRVRASGLVNAVLRRYQRETDRCRELVEEKVPTRYSYPDWMVDVLSKDWPEKYIEILQQGNERAPMWLRVNRKRVDVDAWMESVKEHKPVVSVHAPTAVKLDAPVAVSQLAGFGEGLVSVQDAGAQLATPLLQLESGQRVLDACAAPGGKSCHMLETADIALTALDNDATRLERVQENLQRLDLQAKLVKGDATRPQEWWDGQPFDRILLDVPCSATGVIRRHPDIKLLRRRADIGSLAQRQLDILRAVWPLLAPGGKLLYASCSVLRAENTDVVEAFLNSESRARSVALKTEWGINSGFGRQILTGEAGMDGFYYSILEAA
ncbi:MAG: 16S rRNA (cytosine(967)-C(5))-methyltransferase RsmB [Gammaproteobacteria bacterium]|nr:16S rRNA (cytosine(967)-C(5))-methyltransferase RsmB [Gammaproteobacteria bacterium]